MSDLIHITYEQFRAAASRKISAICGVSLDDWPDAVDAADYWIEDNATKEDHLHSIKEFVNAVLEEEGLNELMEDL